MKKNDPFDWTIRLYGQRGEAVAPLQTETHKFNGTIDAALAEADELESGVEFDVSTVIVHREVAGGILLSQIKP